MTAAQIGRCVAAGAHDEGRQRARLADTGLDQAPALFDRRLTRFDHFVFDRFDRFGPPSAPFFGEPAASAPLRVCAVAAPRAVRREWSNASGRTRVVKQPMAESTTPQPGEARAAGRSDQAASSQTGPFFLTNFLTSGQKVESGCFTSDQTVNQAVFDQRSKSASGYLFRLILTPLPSFPSCSALNIQYNTTNKI